jgi:hypothetical protein
VRRPVRPLRLAGIAVALVAALALVGLGAARLLWFDGTEEAPPFTLPPRASVEP